MHTDGDRAMNEKDDQEELERKLAQARRLAAQASDQTTKGLLADVVDELEDKLLEHKLSKTKE
jgi:DNA-binding ferritin-like protein